MYPFTTQQLQYLNQLEEDGPAHSLRDGLKAASWVYVESQMLTELESLLDQARRQALDTGPMGARVHAMLRTEEGRRQLQPYLVEAAVRGVAFPDVDNVDAMAAMAARAGVDVSVISDVYRNNVAVWEERTKAERSWTSGKSNRGKRGGGGKRPGPGGRGKKAKTAMELEMDFVQMEIEYFIEWLGKTNFAVLATRSRTQTP